MKNRTLRTPHPSVFQALLFLICGMIAATLGLHAEPPKTTSGNPIFPGWYADPEVAVFDHEYWIYPTYSHKRPEQVFFDAFSSPDLVHWTKHEKIVDKSMFSWAKQEMWAPAMNRKEGKYYFFFSANDLHHDGDPGGIGIAVADQPGGPYKDYLGKPLLNTFYNGAQPIDQFVFADKDGQRYMIYGGWGHCNIVKLNADFTGFVPLPDGTLFKEITPSGYVEGPCMFLRDGKYYLMWSEGFWESSNYNIDYSMGDSPTGPFKRIGKVMLTDPAIGSGAGHHSILQIPGQDRWFIVYHRRPPGETDGDSRVTCIDRMDFNPDGTIQPVKMTNEGVPPCPLP